MASEPLEGFHKVNLASPTTPDLHGLTSDIRPQCHSAPSSALYHTPSLSSSPFPPNALRADQLPTLPIYSAPRLLGTEGVFLSGEEGEESLGLTNDSLSRLRSPSVMEIREKANERLKEELAKAQRLNIS
ncbi:rab-3A-interacting protein-like [Oncorhynchus keta]|uniref:rab-3A-interacting protein-like n=1 Tax=Oncorhynchus keta TaxID=8018 RepID=UPI00227ABA4D|nr:rab-3A-interacting protein-like [Oncorhynchus keta]